MHISNIKIVFIRCLILTILQAILINADSDDDDPISEPTEEEWHMDFMPSQYKLKAFDRIQRRAAQIIGDKLISKQLDSLAMRRDVSSLCVFYRIFHGERSIKLYDLVPSAKFHNCTTGYLPDSVYRELAWYGILQIQPLHHSTKHKVAAQLIWQHTLGRPHVIMESPPQSTQSEGKVSRQILAEEAAKWSREQRAAQEVLMENIKSGGNGLTVRTVVTARYKTTFIIQNGNYYECPEGSEPDLDAYRVQANMHERKCTFGHNSISVPVDPCIEAETAPIEYSFHEGWMFCLGNGERENNYFQNGTLDCGNKTKISVNEFLEQCAIDNNVVISFEYFGDEPRKDMMHNATLCTTWDPCKLSYLYRLEPPPAELSPAFPTETQNPCETTVCPECVAGYTGDDGVPMDLGPD